MVRIRFAPAESLQTLGPSRKLMRIEVERGLPHLDKGVGPRVRISFAPAESPVRTRFPASWWAPATAHGVSGALHRPEVLSVPRAWARGLFNKETFGEDRLVKGKISSPGFLEKAPLSDTARRDILRLETDQIDYLPGLSSSEEGPSVPDQLSRLSPRSGQGRSVGLSCREPARPGQCVVMDWVAIR
jgi:hypothetical protein